MSTGAFVSPPEDPVLNRRLTRAAAAVAAASVLSVWSPQVGYELGLSPSNRAAAAVSVAPSGLKVDVGDTRLFARWNAATDASVTGYKVTYTWLGVVGVVLGGSRTVTVPAPATSATLTGLTNNVSYTVSVTAVNADGESPSSSAVSATPTATGTPLQPTGLTAAVADSAVPLTWTLPVDANRKRVDVYRNGTFLASPAGANATSWTDNAVTNGRTYSYQVVAVNDANPVSRSDYSAAATGAPVDLTPPAVPAGLTASPTDRRVNLSWTANTEPDLDHYVLSGGPLSSVSVTGTSFAVTGLTNGTSYTFALAAVDARGNTSATRTVTARPLDDVAPDVPTGLVAQPADGALSLSWNPSAATDTNAYRVYVDGTFRAAVPAGTTRTTVSRLTNGTTYQVQVSAADAVPNESAKSAPVYGTPVDLTAPSAPTAFVATAGDGSAAFTWNRSPENDVVRYVVRRPGSSANLAVVGASASTATVSGLANGTAGSFVVVAIDGAGNESLPSNVASVTPRDTTPPAAPRNLSGSAGDGAVSLSWDAGTEPDLDHYVVRNGTGATVATVTKDVRTVSVGNLANDTAVTFTVVAVDTAGNVSGSSNAVTVTPRDTTPPSAPTGLMATPGDGRATLRWTGSPETDVATYLVKNSSGATVATISAPGTTATVTGLTNGTSSSFTVVAVDRAGNASAASAAVTVTPVDTTPPSAPSAVGSSAGDSTVTVTWTRSSDPDVDHYDVVDQTGTVRATAPASASSATVGGLSNGTTYTFSVVAVDAAGNRSGAGAAPGATPSAPQLPAPTGLSGTPGNSAVTLQWSAVPGAVSYDVLVNGTVVQSAMTTSATVTGVTNGTASSFAVRAVASSGQRGATSSPVVLTPTAPATGGGTPSPTGSGGGSGTALSRDGRFTVFGTAAQLEPSDTNTQYELYVKDGVTGSVTRLAPAAAGTDLSASRVAISDDGRYAVVTTTAALVASDTNRALDVYRLDRQTGVWQLVSVPSSGAVSTTAGTDVVTGNRVYSTAPSVAMTADGNQVFFFSSRSDLVPGDTNAARDLFRKDLTTGGVVRVDVDPNGNQIAGGTIGAALDVTPDGRYVLFATALQNSPVLWRKDLQTGALEVAAGAGTWGSVNYTARVDLGANDVSLSDDGRFTAFSSNDSRFTSASGEYLAYRQDMTTRQVVRAGIVGQKTTWEHGVQLDPTGRFAFFATTADYGADTDQHTDWYRRDLDAAGTDPAMVTSQASGAPSSRRMTSDVMPAEFGSIVVLSGSSVVVATMQALVASDTNGKMDLYAKDLGSGAVSPLA